MLTHPESRASTSRPAARRSASFISRLPLLRVATQIGPSSVSIFSSSRAAFSPTPPNDFTGARTARSPKLCAT
jgi:hypothetical protein